MRVLVACEFSGRVRDAFTARGHLAVSCDLLPSETNGIHFQGDVLDMLYAGWDMLIAFPPCTNLSTAGLPAWERKQADGSQPRALDFVRTLMEADIPQIVIENPSGIINTSIRKPDQIIQPWQFGEPWRKRTCLWLKNLPPLIPTNVVEPTGYWVGHGMNSDYVRRAKGVHSTYGDKGLHGEARTRHRCLTFRGIAEAMADQWGAADEMELAA